jgi:hypothetical protein
MLMNDELKSTNIFDNYPQITLILTTFIITGLNALMTNLLNFGSQNLSFRWLMIFFRKYFFWEKIKSQIDICATQTNYFGQRIFSFPIAYKAIIYILIKNDIKIKKMIQPADYYLTNNNEYCFYIDSENETDEYEIDDKIRIKFNKRYEYAGKDKPQIVNLVISIYSFFHDLKYLNEKIKKWISDYKDENEIYKDDGKKYYFSLRDNIGSTLKNYTENKNHNKNDQNDQYNQNQNNDNTSKNNTIWNLSEMKSCKTFSNTFFTDKDILIKRLKYFMENEDLYNRRGIPYNIGIMMHGLPGCGKTSCIKAIADLTNRHIVEVNLRKIKTCGEFENIFYENKMNDLFIPHFRKMIILEDIDCMMSIIQSRENKTENESDDFDIVNKVDNDVTKFLFLQEKMFSKCKNRKYCSTDELTLSCILNTIDGVLENYGRILIITTNYPEKIDNALLRPGRIDMKIEFTKCTSKMISDIINNFYENNKIIEDVEFPEYKYSPAEIFELCALHYDDQDKVINIINNNLNI